MKIIDITLDLETCALCPTAAVMSVGAVAWNRYGEDSPFTRNEFYRHVDLRSSFTDGFTFDPDTAAWWAKQNPEAKEALLEYDDEPIVSIETVIKQLCEWIKFVQHNECADEVYLWSQGSDFDIAILRNICDKYGIALPIKYVNFRDHRTFFLESAHLILRNAECEDFSTKRAYEMVDAYQEGKPHDPIFDCKRSIYSTWQMMHMLSAIPTPSIA